ncbi:MAG: smalltalk protein [Bacteroidaceae bacterium]|nr:smalltalk protein [Bacteroidaceae bacterium]MBO4801515.1 smalltalk protein [Bacteroidaceae bacterium]MBO4801823.1 smalltalk protein [Bacteroidaceae bacterium]
MKKETWKRILDIVITILTAIVTALTTTSCMGRGPF